jgi:hypothetical protein
MKISYQLNVYVYTLWVLDYVYACLIFWHYANAGYLYAILHGAKVIWDFDDDNILLEKQLSFTIVPGSNPSAKSENTSTLFSGALEAVGYEGLGVLSFNPYPLMACPHDPCKYRAYLRSFLYELGHIFFLCDIADHLVHWRYSRGEIREEGGGRR